MSKVSPSPALKWILIAVIGVMILGAVLIFLLATYPAEDYRAAQELESRGLDVTYARQGYTVWEFPNSVVGRDRKITTDDCRLICRLSRLQSIHFFACDMSDLNLDGIGNCRELDTFFFATSTQTQLPMNEIQKLTACPSLKVLCLHCNRCNEFSEDNADAVFLECFERMPRLRYLLLPPSSVTKEGLEELQKKRPDVSIDLVTHYGTTHLANARN